VIRVVRLSHSFGDRQVLREVTFDVQTGETVCVMGASGGGKTTLLRCMSGLLSPTAGDVWIDDCHVFSAQPSRLRELRLSTGVLFQSGALFDYLTVRENVLFGVSRHRKMSNSEANEIVATSLSLVGLEDAESLLPSELSGGMRKRVGLARALATKPTTLFYDEPTSGLDPISAYAIDTLIADLANRLKVTSVVVSHNLQSVMRVANRVLFLYEGELIADDTPAAFRSTTDPRIREIIRKSEAESLSSVN
jgi:phospholipid/cholesterol/gamma-HCH transport system ATP-binding protein